MKNLFVLCAVILYPMTPIFALEGTEKLGNPVEIGVESTDAPDSENSSEDFDYLDEYDDDFEDDLAQVADPLYHWNYGMYVVNDRLYFWILKPVATGYSKIVPEVGRLSIKNFYLNLVTPVRFVNCVLQRKFKKAGKEVAGFAINSTLGLAGFLNPAEKKYQIKRCHEDLGQTLGSYRVGHGFYLVWPLLGPSSLRDSLGMAGDSFLTPTIYLPIPWNIASRVVSRINSTSLNLGRYEDLKASALDVYRAMRDGYIQKREQKVAE